MPALKEKRGGAKNSVQRPGRIRAAASNNGHAKHRLQSQTIHRVSVDPLGGGAVNEVDSHLTLRAVAELCSQLQFLQTQRTAAIKAQRRINSQVNALLARALGFYSLGKADEKTRKAAWDAADDCRRKLEAGEPPDDPRATPYLGFVMAAAQGRSAFDALRAGYEKIMRKLARELPVWPAVDAIAGVAELGLAVLIGEAGDLSNYPHHKMLWKRMGLAVLHGCRQGNPGKDATAEAWIEHGYNKARRSVVWTIGTSICMGAYPAKDGRSAGPTLDSPYMRLLNARKEYELARGLKLGHAHNRAKRYMEKALLRDIWCLWNGRPIWTPG